MYIATLYDGACTLFITGLIGWFSLCVFMYTFSCGAIDLIFNRYLCELKPKYISIKINGRRQQDRTTTTNVIRFRINQEIKSLYKKKQHFNQQLYQAQLECEHQYNGMWQHIQDFIDQQVHKIMESQYQKLNKNWTR